MPTSPSIACAGVDLEKGLTNTNLFEFTKRTMMEVSRKVVPVADHSKFGQARLASFGTLDEVDMIITDSGIDEETLRKFRVGRSQDQRLCREGVRVGA